MNPSELTQAFCAAVEAEDGGRLAALFAPDGIYHDIFYGAFEGRAAIAAMIRDRFCRDATEFRWDMRDPVCDGTTLYARYLFSYRSRLPGSAGKRAMFEGVAIMTLRDGLIASYTEVANPTPGFVDLGFAAERIARIGARQGRALRERADAARHLG